MITMEIISKKHGNHSMFLDEDDYSKIIKNKIWLNVCPGGQKYAVIYKNKKLIKVHRVVLNLTDKNIIVDHINGNGLDNRKCNLRISTPSKNGANRKKSSPTVFKTASKYKGVSLTKNKTNGFYARIVKNKRNIFLGVFKTEEEAAMAYNNKAVELFGEHALLNKIEETR